MSTGREHLALGIILGNGFGTHPGAWRMPHADVDAYTDIAVTVEQALSAERGGIDFLFLPERLYLHGDLAEAPPVFAIDPVVTLAALAQATSRIGLVGTVATSFSEPYVLARHLKALDVISHGRAGWNAVPGYEPDAFANVGRPLPPRERKYERLHEVVQVVQALWGSWGPDAGRPDKDGAYADPARVRPVDLQGQHVGSRGPLPVPPSEQGQPVIIQPASSGYGLQAAGMYADVVIGMPSTVEESRAQRDVVRDAATAAGRDPDDIRYIAFVSFALGDTERAALDRRRTLDDHLDQPTQLARLSALLGVPLAPDRADQPLDPRELAAARAHPGHAASALVRAGVSPRDVLAHGVLDPYPSVTGTPEQAADHLQEWFEAGAADGFMLNVDDFRDGVDAFVDGVVPLLRGRGLVPDGYRGTTLRDHLGLAPQHGIDPRLAAGPVDPPR